MVWFRRPDPFLSVTIATVFGLLVGAIVSIGSHTDAVEMSPVRCQDRVVALSVSNTCPQGTFIELESDGNGENFIVCHCEQPLRFIIQMSPSLEQVEPFILPTPEVRPEPGPIEL